MTPEEKAAASQLLVALDVIEGHLPTPLPATVRGIVAAVEASALTTEQKAYAVEALHLCDGYHIIGANLAGPHGYASIDAMRADVQRKINARGM